MKDKMIKIRVRDLEEMVYWARRYCDGRSTYAPTSFNSTYKSIKSSYADLEKNKQVDQTLSHDSKFWPYAQDGMYNPGQLGSIDATQ